MATAQKPAALKQRGSSRRPGRPPAAPPARGRRPFRDNPPLILAGIVILLAALGGIVWLADRTSTLAPDFLTEVVLIALSATNVTMLLALVFVLARNVIKSLVEGRRGLPFGRFRAKLVLAMLGMTVIPAVLVLIVGSQRGADRPSITGSTAGGGDPRRPTASLAITTRTQQTVADQAPRGWPALAPVDSAPDVIRRCVQIW